MCFIYGRTVYLIYPGSREREWGIFVVGGEEKVHEFGHYVCVCIDRRTFFFFFCWKSTFSHENPTHTHTHILRYNTCNITTTNIISSFIRFSKWIIQRFLFHIYTYTSIYVYIVVATRNKSRMTLIVNIILYNLRVYIVPRMTDPFRSWCVRAREINSEISTTILVGLKNFRHRDVFYSYSLFI